MRRLSFVLLLLLPLGLFGIGCDDGTAPVIESVTEAELPGAYTATTLTVDFGVGPVDILATGGSIQLTLEVGGATSGTMFAPGGGDGGEDFSASLEGTWSFAQPILTLDHVADTFLRDMDLTATRVDGVVQLEGEETFGGETLHVLLQKAP